MVMLLVRVAESALRTKIPLTSALGAQTSIVQSLTYFEHLSEPMAEFLHILAEQYDYPQLSDEILKCVTWTVFMRASFADLRPGSLETRNSIRTTLGDLNLSLPSSSSCRSLPRG